MTSISDFDDSAAHAVDMEHKIELDLVEALCLEVRNGKDQRAIASALQQLSDYTETHFISEELLMRLNMYDSYAEHVKDHVHTLEVLRELSINHALGTSSLVSGKIVSVLEFITHHIATHDRRFSEHLLRQKMELNYWYF